MAAWARSDPIARPAPGRERLVRSLDLLIIAALAVGGVVHDDGAGLPGALLRISIAVPLLWRHRAPVAAFCVMWALAAVEGLLYSPSMVDAALLIALYAVATTRDLRTTLLAGAALEAGVVLAVSWKIGGFDQWGRAFVALTGLATAAGVLGVNVRNRRQTLADLRARADRLERERERELAFARVTERSRIAREMHDVVAHNLSVMVALCDGAACQVHRAPDRAQSALDQASRTGRQALAEMRQLLGVLREAPAARARTEPAPAERLPAEPAPEMAPQPGIAQLDALVSRVRAAGVPVSLTVAGEPDEVPPGLELAVYRIVQEALTNTIKHAGSGAAASVRIEWAHDAIGIEVVDTGAGGPGAGATGGGGGLRGMRERAAIYGGTVDAGPGPHAGWRVRASLRVPSAVGAAR